jgi:hypothetical protein
MKPPPHLRAISLSALGYVLLTIAYSWPLPIRLGDVTHDYGDPLLNTWILWWTTKAVPLTAHWWNAPIFYPATGTFAFSEHLLGLAPVAAPLIALTGNPLVGYNVTLLASYVLSALGAHFLAYTLTRRHDAAFVAGIAFAFAPYRLAQLPHIQVLCAYWTPVCLAALHRYGRGGATKWAALAALAWFMQALSNGYYLFFLSVLLALWFVWFAVGRWTPTQWIKIAGFFAAAAVLLTPILVGYKHILEDTYDFHRGLEEIQTFSADVAALWTASPDLLLWSWLRSVDKPEGELFPGLTLAVLVLFGVIATRPLLRQEESHQRRLARRALAALAILFVMTAALPIYYGAWRLTIGDIRLISIARPDKPLLLALLAGIGWMAFLPRVVAAIRRRSLVFFYAAAALAVSVLALGPDPMILKHRLLYQAPYGWLMRLPGFDGLRVPARFWMMALACLSVLAALAVNRLQGRTRRIVTAVAAVGLLLDGWPRSFIVLDAPEHRPSPPGVAARLDLPMDDDHDAIAVYQQMFDPVPLYNGFSGYIAPHIYATRELLNAHDRRILDALTARGSLGVVVDHSAEGADGFRKYLEAYPGSALVETHAGWSSYRLPANSAPPNLPEAAGQPLAIKSVDSTPSPPHAPRAIDGSLKTRWSGGVQRSAADYTIELADPGRVSQVVTELGEFMTDFPMRLQLDVSEDGTQWDTVYLGDTALQAYYAAVRHPITVPIVIPVNRDRVRFIRMKQLGWGKHDWSIAELQVLR